MRQMDSMMNSMMDPFASMMSMHHQMMGIQPPSQQRHPVGSMVPFGGMPGFPMGMGMGMAMDPFGMPSIGQMFQSLVRINKKRCEKIDLKANLWA